MRWAYISAAAIVVTVLAAWQQGGWMALDGPAAAAPLPGPQPARANAADQAAGHAAPPADSGAGGDGLQRVPLPAVDTRAPAWLSMAQARENGDDRTPPIERDQPAAATAPADLSDQRAYADAEQTRNRQLAAAFSAAAAEELLRLQADLERGRAAGIAAQELAKLREKIRRIAQQKQHIAGGRSLR